MKNNEQDTTFIGHIFSASLSLMAILIGVIGLLVAKFIDIEDVGGRIVFDFRLLIIGSIILVVTSCIISFLCIFYLKGFSISVNIIFFLLISLLTLVTIGIPYWGITAIF